MAGNFLQGLFSGAPPTVLDTLDQLNKARAQRIANALNQIKLNYAPQMAQQAADTGAADVSIEQNKAKYAPQMSMADLAQKHAQTMYEQAETAKSYLQSKGAQLDNVIKKAQASHADESVQNDLQIQRAKIGLLQAQANQASSKAKSLGGVSAKNAPTYYDKTGAQIAAPNQQLDNSGMASPSAAPAAPQDNAPTPTQQAPNAPLQQTSEQTFPGADPNAPDVLQSIGPVDSRGHAAAVRNLRTGERFTVLTPTGREKMRNQLVSLRQAVPYIDDLIKYGTVGAIGPSGKNELIPNALGGVPRAVGANYDKSLAAASEHIMTGSQMQKTDKTTDMINTILNRQNFESRADYTSRMLRLQKHLKDLDENTKNALGMNMMSLDRYTGDDEQKYLESEYDNLTKGTVDVISPDGRPATVPKENLEKALARGYRRA